MVNTLLTNFDPVLARSYYASGHWGQDTIYDYARKNAEKSPSKIAVLSRFQAITYAQLIDAADRLAYDLSQQGLVQGSRVAVWLPSRPETLVAVLACSRNGYVCCPSLHRDHTVMEIRDLLVRQSAAALIYERNYGSNGDRIDMVEQAKSVETLRKVYLLSSSQGEGALFADLGAAPKDAKPTGASDNIVYLAFTSGTTGVPKGVMHSNNTLLANARSISQDWSLLEDSVIYSMSPLSHNLGFGASIMTMMRGGTFVLHDLARGASLVDRLLETKSTFIFGVPTHAIDLLAELRARGLKSLGNVRGMRISGASVPPSVAAGLLEQGVVPQSGFGMTEAGSHNYTLPNDDADTICNTSGYPCSGYEVKIFDEANMNSPVATGTPGLIAGRGASLMLGYFNDQGATEESFNADGWFITGDLGWIDERGCLRVTGRKKDIIVRGGHKIYPARVEALMMQHLAVERAAAIPVADDRLGEKLCVTFVPRKGADISYDDMLRHLDQVGLSRYEMPEYALSMDAMPMTPSGKILKREIIAGVDAGKIVPQAVRYDPAKHATDKGGA